MGFALPSPPTPSIRIRLPTPSPESEPDCAEGEDEAGTCIQSQGSEQGVSRALGFVWTLKDWRGLQKLRWGWERRGVVSGTIQGRGHGSAKGMEWCTSQ